MERPADHLASALQITSEPDVQQQSSLLGYMLKLRKLVEVAQLRHLLQTTGVNVYSYGNPKVAEC